MGVDDRWADSVERRIESGRAEVSALGATVATVAGGLGAATELLADHESRLRTAATHADVTEVEKVANSARAMAAKTAGELRALEGRVLTEAAVADIRARVRSLEDTRTEQAGQLKMLRWVIDNPGKAAAFVGVLGGGSLVGGSAMMGDDLPAVQDYITDTGDVDLAALIEEAGKAGAAAALAADADGSY